MQKQKTSGWQVICRLNPRVLLIEQSVGARTRIIDAESTND